MLADENLMRALELYENGAYREYDDRYANDQPDEEDERERWQITYPRAYDSLFTKGEW